MAGYWFYVAGVMLFAGGLGNARFSQALAGLFLMLGALCL